MVPAVRLPHLPALDGLRAVAVVGVLLYHSSFGWARGGFLGVEVFFVLSGYLITSLLVAQWWDRGDVGLGQFWANRARRLLPALTALLVVTAVVTTVGLPNSVGQFRGDVTAAATYVSNWWQVLRHQSYFEQLGRPPMLQHLWSLAVEEQFYLIWPLVLVALLRRSHRRPQRLVVPVLAAAVASSVWMAVVANPLDPSRAYYGTDTRAAGLLIGAAAALCWHPSRLSTHLARSVRLALETAGVVGLAAIVWMLGHVSEFDPRLYRGGFLLVDVATVTIICASVHPAGRLTKLALGPRLLGWIGTRSYGIYLWHWPVFVLTRPHLDVALTGWPLFALRVAVTLALAEASYRWVELPFRRGRTSDRSAIVVPITPRRPRVPMVALLVGAALMAVVLVVPGRERSAAAAGVTARATGGGRTAELAAAVEAAAQRALVRRRVAAPAAGPSAVGAPGSAAPVAPPVPPAPTVTAVGDSVLLDGAGALAQLVPGIEVDAVLGRQFGAGLGEVQARQAAHRLGRQVVISLGTNGVVMQSEFDQLLQALRGVQRVVVVNVSVPRPWQDPDNQVLAGGVRRYPNAVLVDWHAAISAHSDWVYSDGVHLRPQAASLYAQLVSAALSR